MDFTLPDPVFKRIFDFLPFVDRVRVGRVSSSFREISQIFASRITSLPLNDKLFSKLSDMQFEAILDSCKHGLRSIKFSDTGANLVRKFSELTCPQLVDLDLSRVTITNGEFSQVVSKYPGLKSLKWWCVNNVRIRRIGTVVRYIAFPDVVLSRLETLHLREVNDEMLERLIDRCPNLRALWLDLDLCDSEDVWDRFFRSVPRLETLTLNLSRCTVRMEDLQWFWRLQLTTLELDSRWTEIESPNDDFVSKLVRHFSQIECLELSLANLSPDGIAQLGRLERLRVAEFSTNDYGSVVDLRELASCHRLEEVTLFVSSINDETCSALFASCPNLQRLAIVRGVMHDQGLVNTTTAVQLLSSLANKKPRRSPICLQFRALNREETEALQSSWGSAEVGAVVCDLKDNHGIVVDIQIIECMHG